MTPDDYKYITTLVLSVAGIQTTIFLAFIGLMFRSIGTTFKAIDKRLELIEKRLDRIEGIILENRKVVQ